MKMWKAWSMITFTTAGPGQKGVIEDHGRSYSHGWLGCNGWQVRCWNYSMEICGWMLEGESVYGCLKVWRHHVIQKKSSWCQEKAGRGLSEACRWVKYPAVTVAEQWALAYKVTWCGRLFCLQCVSASWVWLKMVKEVTLEHFGWMVTVWDRDFVLFLFF